MDWTRWLVVAFGLAWCFVFGVLAWVLKRYSQHANEDRIRWTIMAALAWMGGVIGVTWGTLPFLPLDQARLLSRASVIVSMLPLGVIAWRFMGRYWPWRWPRG